MAVSDESQNGGEDAAENAGGDAARAGDGATAASAAEAVAQGVAVVPEDAVPVEDDGSEVIPVRSAPLTRAAAKSSETAIAEAAQKAIEAAGEINFQWYILKVQSNREKSIADALRRKVRVEGLDRYFDKDEDGNPLVIVPTEKVTEFKAGKKKIVERKLYPGYICVRMHITDETWFAVRDTAGIGDFTGAGGKPSPMAPHEVARITPSKEEESTETPKLDIKFKVTDRVKVKDGTFEGFEGEVSAIDGQSGKITVMISIFGRSTPVELEYWQVEGV